jgi:hypothetical protein
MSQHLAAREPHAFNLKQLIAKIHERVSEFMLTHSANEQTRILS